MQTIKLRAAGDPKRAIGILKQLAEIDSIPLKRTPSKRNSPPSGVPIQRYPSRVSASAEMADEISPSSLPQART